MKNNYKICKKIINQEIPIVMKPANYPQKRKVKNLSAYAAEIATEVEKVKEAKISKILPANSKAP